MAEYIEREALWKLFKREYEVAKPNYKRGWQGALQLLYDAPAADVAPVVHGKWEIVEVYGKTARYRCTACKTEMVDYMGREGYHRYCHICGAKMEEAR